MAIRRRHRAHLGVRHSQSVDDNGSGISAARACRENADQMNVGWARHLPGSEEVSTGSLRFDQSWNEPS